MRLSTREAIAASVFRLVDDATIHWCRAGVDAFPAVSAVAAAVVVVVVFVINLAVVFEVAAVPLCIGHGIHRTRHRKHPVLHLDTNLVFALISTVADLIVVVIVVVVVVLGDIVVIVVAPTVLACCSVSLQAVLPVVFFVVWRIWRM